MLPPSLSSSELCSMFPLLSSEHNQSPLTSIASRYSSYYVHVFIQDVKTDRRTKAAYVKHLDVSIHIVRLSPPFIELIKVERSMREFIYLLAPQQKFYIASGRFMIESLKRCILNLRFVPRNLYRSGYGEI